MRSAGGDLQAEGWPDAAFDPGGAPLTITLQLCNGERRTIDTAAWHHLDHPADIGVVETVEGPVLDVGCGPGRHSAALARRGVPALGLDISPAALAAAARRGASVHHGSVFGDVPLAGRWATILLLDGNIGIGGHPVRLLDRCRQLLRPGGNLLVETDPPGGTDHAGVATAEVHGEGRRWFPWATVSAGSLARLASAAGFEVAASWAMEGRWLSRLHAPPAAPRHPAPAPESRLR